jgi:hypothetical protein
MNPYTETQIRDRAYALWEEAGRPEGQDMEFWMMAERELSERSDATEEHVVLDPVTAAATGGLPTR